MRTQHVQNRTVPADDDARERLVARAPLTRRRLSLSGAPTALLEAGGGPPLVLLHGQGGFAGLWVSVERRRRRMGEAWEPFLAHLVDRSCTASVAEQPQAFLHALRLLLQSPSTGAATRS